MSIRRRFVAIVAGVAVLLPASSPAAGQPTGGAGYGDLDGQPGVWAGYLEAPREVATPDRSGGAAPTHWCGFWLPMFSGDIDPVTARAYFGNPDRRERAVEVGGLYFMQCFRNGEAEPYFTQVRLIDPVDPIGGVITTRPSVVAHARALLALDAPRVTTQPPPDRLVTGFETWFDAVAGVPAPRTAQAGTFWATAEARPIAVRIETGDGTVVECPVEPGPPRSEQSPCARHTYLDSRLAPGGDGRFTVRAQVTYQVWVTTDLGGPTLADEVVGPATAIPVIVRPVVAVLR